MLHFLEVFSQLSAILYLETTSKELKSSNVWFLLGMGGKFHSLDVIPLLTRAALYMNTELRTRGSNPAYALLAVQSGPGPGRVKLTSQGP